ncbi:unnamed protein product [Cyprideis torosa]|uniref:Neurotransmitter-gated ion-channel transmembrane domain-containing protein n=1 Tax=Cyprideis torosa TaxID=163714 RepID=A0A7R8W642_9CRUS|nr:unnamed protein product [Cyprideis torosa]CAG0886074.1 unnamed protein product [Cyprideis torosa]
MTTLIRRWLHYSFLRRHRPVVPWWAGEAPPVTSGNYSCLRVELLFTRDKAFYYSTVFIPGIILVTSSFITFWLEWSAAPARVVIGVTTLLTYFTTSNGFRTSLPVVSNLGAMNVWDGVCMFFIYASLLEFVAVNYIGRKKPHGDVVYTPGENLVMQFGRSREPTRRRQGEPCCTANPATGDVLSLRCADCEEAGELCIHAPRVSPFPVVENCVTEGGNGLRQRGNHVGSPLRIPGASTTEEIPLSPGNPATELVKTPHPIRIAKTIDVCSRVVFPACFAFFLLYFFVKYHAYAHAYLKHREDGMSYSVDGKTV